MKVRLGDAMKPRLRLVTLVAFLYSLCILALGYISFGLWPTVVFASGFLGGFVLWLVVPTRAPFTRIKVPYWLTFFLFFLHRVEEYVFKFQEALSRLTGVPVPKVSSFSLVALVLASVAAWAIAPILLQRGYAFGRYLAWTFFAAMGITELAHFVFPLFTHGPYGYFPGMATVVLLAPAAWWGIWRLAASGTLRAKTGDQ